MQGAWGSLTACSTGLRGWPPAAGNVSDRNSAALECVAGPVATPNPRITCVVARSWLCRCCYPRRSRPSQRPIESRRTLSLWSS